MLNTKLNISTEPPQNLAAWLANMGQTVARAFSKKKHKYSLQAVRYQSSFGCLSRHSGVGATVGSRQEQESLNKLTLSACPT